ncbi:porin [Paraburkholderia dipogonis]|uniref:porin n=1 Tax=Paraburkholderia dipogonis TaxID=1211383 RepID=UPI0038B7B0DC
MKIKTITLATGMLVCGAASAQSSVTLYGAIDTGLRYTTNAATSKNATTWGLGSGALMGSRFGLKGSEDIGNGTAVRFVLEDGFIPTTGAFDQQGQLFGRQAWVGIDNPTYGMLQAGRIYSIPFWQLSNYDAFNFPNYLQEAWETRFFGVRLDNSAKYSFSRAGFGLQLQHSFGGQAGDFQAGSTDAIALTYNGSGLAVGAVAQRSSDAADRHANVFGGGANYSLGPVTLYGLYIYSKRDAGFTVGTASGSALANTSILSNANTAAGVNKQTASRRDSYAEIGANYRVTPALSVGASLMLDNVAGVAGDAGGKIKTLVALIDYRLSKRTDIYAELDRNVLNGASVTDPNNPVGSFGGRASQTGATLGLRTLF